MSAESYRLPEKEKSLDDLLARIAESDNERYGRFLNPDCSIDMENFRGLAGYDVKNDKEKIEESEREWSGADTTNENMLAYFSDLGLNTPEARLSYWKNKKEMSENEKLEKAMVALFHNVLGQEFLVARTSTFDDYRNHVDTLIIDSKTQKVIGAFDEVKGEEVFKRNREKKEKVLKQAKGGGAKIKYGVNFQNDISGDGQKLVRKEIRNLPLLMVSLTKDELRELLAGMSYDVQVKVSDVEFRTFNKIMASFDEQIKMLENEKRNIPPAVFSNIQTFKESLGRMKKLGAEA